MDGVCAQSRKRKQILTDIIAVSWRLKAVWILSQGALSEAGAPAGETRVHGEDVEAAVVLFRGLSLHFSQPLSGRRPCGIRICT